MTKGEVIALEGVCCAGKTTLLKGISKRMSAGVIPELPEFGRNLFKPFDSAENISSNSINSIPIEKVRMIAARSLGAIARSVVMDRTYFSTLALGYGAIDVTGIDSYKKLSDTVLSMINKKELPTPDKLLYVDVDATTVEQRNLQRVPRLEDYWVEKGRITRQNEFYYNLTRLAGVTMVYGNNRPEVVLSDCLDAISHDGMLSVQEAIAQIEDFNDKVL